MLKILSAEMMELLENGADDEKYVIFKQDDLFSESFPLMKGKAGFLFVCNMR